MVDLDVLRDDRSLNGEGLASTAHSYDVEPAQLASLFFGRYGLSWIVEYVFARDLTLRVVTHPTERNTCFEKAELLGADWSPLNVIKAVYLRDTQTSGLYAFAIPETGCFLDQARLRQALGGSDAIGALEVSPVLPANMVLGTCSPFVSAADGVTAILFDSETLIEKKHDRTLDDFSFGSTGG